MESPSPADASGQVLFESVSRRVEATPGTLTSTQTRRAAHRKVSSKPRKGPRGIGARSANRLNHFAFRTQFLEKDSENGAVTRLVRRCCTGSNCLRTLAGCASDTDESPPRLESFLANVERTRLDLYSGRNQNEHRDELLEILKKNYRVDAPPVDAMCVDGAAPSVAGTQQWIWMGQKVKPHVMPGRFLTPPGSISITRILCPHTGHASEKSTLWRKVMIIGARHIGASAQD